MESYQSIPVESLYIKKFALGLFMRADKQERSGKASMRTAKTFYAASLFFEILVNFGDLQPDVLQKQQYAAWRAAEIFKALKGKSKNLLKRENQYPSSLPASAKSSTNPNDGSISPVLNSGEPAVDALSTQFSGVVQKMGVLGQEQILSSSMLSWEASSDSRLTVRVVSSSSVAMNHLDKRESSDEDEDFYDCSDAELSALSSTDEHESVSSSDGSVDVADEGFHPSTGDIAKAQKVARLAVSALAFDDVPSAIAYLEQSLNLLTKNSEK